MSFTSSLLWTSVAQIISFALQFMSSIVIARYLTPLETGIFSIASATVGMVSVLQALGLQPFLIRERELSPALEATTFTLNAITALVLAFAILVVGQSSVIVQDAGARHVMMVLAVLPLIGIFSFLPSAKLERRGQFQRLSLASIACNAVGAIITMTFIADNYGFMGIAYGQVATALSASLIFNVMGRRDSSLRFTLIEWRRVYVFALQMLTISGLNAFSLRISDVIMGRTLGLYQLGIYGRANGLNSLLWSNLNVVIGRVVLVDFAEVQRKGEPLRERYNMALASITGLLWPAFAGLSILSKYIINSVYGPKWQEAAAPLSILAVASMIQVSVALSWELFAITGRLTFQTKVEMFRTLSALAMFTVACLVSMTLAALTRVIDAVLAVLLYLPQLSRMTNSDLRDFLFIYGKSLIVTSFAIFPAGMLAALRPNPTDVTFIVLISTVVVGVCLWTLSLFVFRHPLSLELTRLYRAVFQKNYGRRVR